MHNLVAKLNKSTIVPDGDGNFEIAFSNVRNRAYRLSRLVRDCNPDHYELEYILAGSTILEKMDFETLESAYRVFDSAIRCGASYVLFRAVWVSPGGEGEVYVNVGLHDQQA